MSREVFHDVTDVQPGSRACLCGNETVDVAGQWTGFRVTAGDRRVKESVRNWRNGGKDQVNHQ